MITMNKKKEKSIILEQLGDKVSQEVLQAFGMNEDTPEEQAQFLADAGEVIMQRVMLEILKKLPEAALPRFDHLVERGSEQEWKEFLGQYIESPEAFIEDEVKKEVGAIRREMGRV
jgi:hypothetical protein